MVSIRFEHYGSLRPKKRQVTSEIEEWLGSLDYDTVRETRGNGHETPSKSFHFADWRVLLRALPVHPDARGYDMGRIGMGPASGAFMISSVDEIRTILKAKAHQCRGADAPVVVAILNWTTFATDQEVEQALFGSDAVRYIPGNVDSVQPVRSRDGYWHPGPPPRGTHVSAVLYGDHIHASRVVAELPLLWLNPWAHNPLRMALPFSAQTVDNNGTVFQAAELTTDPTVVFDLPPDWPGFNEPSE